MHHLIARRCCSQSSLNLVIYTIRHYLDSENSILIKESKGEKKMTSFSVKTFYPLYLLVLWLRCLWSWSSWCWEPWQWPSSSCLPWLASSFATRWLSVGQGVFDHLKELSKDLCSTLWYFYIRQKLEISFKKRPISAIPRNSATIHWIGMWVGGIPTSSLQDTPRSLKAQW